MRDGKVLLLVLGLFIGGCDGKPGTGVGAGGDVGEGEGGGFFRAIGNGLVRKALRSQGVGDDMQELLDKRFEMADFGEEGPAVDRSSADRLPEGNGDVGYLGENTGSGGFLDENMSSLKGFWGRKSSELGRQIDKVKVLGAPHEAEIEITGGKVGDVVILMDVRGWVIARLVLREDVVAATISVKLDEKTGIAGIERLWRFDVDGAEIVGDLSLYYRDTPVENWYEGAGEDIVRRRDLVVKRIDGAGGLEALDTWVDSGSDQITARVRLVEMERFVVGGGPKSTVASPSPVGGGPKSTVASPSPWGWPN